MAKFKFELEPVLTQRRTRERECRRQLADTLRQRLDLHGKLREMQATITDSKRNLSNGLQGAVDLDRIAGFAQYSGQVTQRARGFVLQLAGVEKQIEAARARLIESTRERKALEALRDQRFAQWKKRIERKEAAELDELATQQFIRRQAQGAG